MPFVGNAINKNTTPISINELIRKLVTRFVLNAHEPIKVVVEKNCRIMNVHDIFVNMDLQF